IEHLLKGDFVNGDNHLTDKDEIVRHHTMFHGTVPMRILQIEIVPGIYKLYEFLTGDSIDRSKNYKFHKRFHYVTYYSRIKNKKWFYSNERGQYIYIS